MNPGPGGRPTDEAPPLILVEGPADGFEAVVAEVRRAGWPVGAGFAGSVTGRREVRAGVVESAEEAAAALLRILEGAGAVIHGRGDRQVLDRLLDDLRHIRRVDLRRGAPAAASDVPALDDDARAILQILAEGRTLGDAAATLGLSRRTADRRLAEARSALGVERTVEAVAQARTLGWLGRERSR